MAAVLTRRCALLRARAGGAGRCFSNAKNYFRHSELAGRRISEPCDCCRVYPEADFLPPPNQRSSPNVYPPDPQTRHCSRIVVAGRMNRTKHHAPWFLRLAAIFLAAAGGAYASERWETLQAINWVENPRNSPQAGPFGELGPYQFRLSTWRSYTKRPFAMALERRYSDEVAVSHYEWIKRGLQSAGIEPTPYNIALAWNAGLDQVVKDRVPASASAYASQVNNLVAMLKGRTAAAGVAVTAPSLP